MISHLNLQFKWSFYKETLFSPHFNWNCKIKLSKPGNSNQHSSTDQLFNRQRVSPWSGEKSHSLFSHHSPNTGPMGWPIHSTPLGESELSSLGEVKAFAVLIPPFQPIVAVLTSLSQSWKVVEAFTSNCGWIGWVAFFWCFEIIVFFLLFCFFFQIVSCIKPC